MWSTPCKTLRLYVLTDIHSPDYFVMPEIHADQFDMVLTLGDIDEGTLDYISHMSRQVPIFGIPGNHDTHSLPGVTNLHGRVVDYKGIRIGGMGGARKYKDHRYHYTDREMRFRMMGMPAVDLFISHAPPFQTSQNEDYIHQGFEAFDHYIAKHSPQFWLHGHLSKNLRHEMDDTKVFGIRERMPIHVEVDLEKSVTSGEANPLHLGDRFSQQFNRLGTLLTLFFPK